ncbi:MAG: chromosomal replication initiator protein DnaA [Planctomycetota bacterium]
MLTRTPMTAVQTDLWSRILDDVKSRIGAERFNLWLHNTQLVTAQDDLVEIGVPNLFVQEWIQERFLADITEVVHVHFPSKPKVCLRIEGALFRKLRESQEKPEVRDVLGRRSPSSLNGAYRLETFVVGPANRLAHMASVAVAEQPGKAYNPLFIYGGSGLGKTHLLQGVANALAVRRDLSVLYQSAEEFTNRFMTAVKSRDFGGFRRFERMVDVLIIDDIHFFADKSATQDEFLHTFNELTTTGKQIVMASDSHPKLLRSLKETLVSRFVSGMVVKLNPPGYETRLKILEAKVRAIRRPVPEEVLGYIASRVRGNVRDIEGFVVKLGAYAALKNVKIDLVLAKDVFAEAGRGDRPVTLADVDTTATRFFHLAPGELRSAKRTRSVTLPRQMAMRLARRFVRASLADIGRYFGERDHATVLAAVKKLDRLAKKNREVGDALTQMAAELNPSDTEE